MYSEKLKTFHIDMMKQLREDQSRDNSQSAFTGVKTLTAINKETLKSSGSNCFEVGYSVT